MKRHIYPDSYKQDVPRNMTGKERTRRTGKLVYVIARPFKCYVALLSGNLTRVHNSHKNKNVELCSFFLEIPPPPLLHYITLEWPPKADTKLTEIQHDRD